MKTTEIFGLISGALVILSVIPYSIRIWQRKITPKITSWSLWTILGLALLLTYRSSGAQYNVLPAIFGFTNPLLITVLAVHRNNDFKEWKFKDLPRIILNELKALNLLDRFCLIFGLISIVMWAYLQGNKNLVQSALYLAIIADACAAIPTIIFLWNEPWQDRPFAWGLFAVGYCISIFAIEEHTFANYALPVYMTIGSASITMLLLAYRLKKKVPLKEWV